MGLNLTLHHVQITTTSLRVKEVSSSKDEVTENGVVATPSPVLYDFPLFSVSYCGTNPAIEEAFSFVAKDSSDGKWVQIYVIRCIII